MKEIDDRKRCEKNVLILNVPEQTKNADGKLNNDYELKKVKFILQKINNIQTKFSIKELYQRHLGTFNNDKTRYICAGLILKHPILSLD